MSNLKDTEIEDLFRRASEKYPLRTDSADWDRMAAALEKDPPQPPDGEEVTDKRRRRRFLFLLLLLPLAGVGYYALQGHGKGAVVAGTAAAVKEGTGGAENANARSGGATGVKPTGGAAIKEGTSAGGASSGSAVATGRTSSGGAVATGGTSSGGAVATGGTSSGGAVATGGSSSGGTVATGANPTGAATIKDGRNAGLRLSAHNGVVSAGTRGAAHTTLLAVNGGDVSGGGLMAAGGSAVGAGGGSVVAARSAGDRSGNGDAASGGSGDRAQNGFEPWRVQGAQMAFIPRDYFLSVLVKGPATVAAGDSSHARKKDKQAMAKHFYAGILGSPDISTVKMQSVKGTGSTFGLLLGYSFNRRWSIETGIYADKKHYYTDGEYFNTKNVYTQPSWKLVNANGVCYMWEIPLNVRYNFNPGAKTAWFATTGLSTYLMSEEKYVYGWESGTSAWNGKADITTPSQYPFSVLNLSGGFEQRLGKVGNLRLEPFLRIPLTGMGTGKLPIMSAGVNIGITHQLW